MGRLIAALLTFAATALAGAPSAQTPDVSGRTPVLAELFTSEGCNTCPPADSLLGMLSGEQPIPGVYVVALSEHVTYWDHQGWRDPFGSTKFDTRQNMYAFRFGVVDVFTPQLIVDGSAQMVGSETDKIRKALAEAGRVPKPPLIVSAAADGANAVVASVSGPGIAAGAADGADLLWAVVEDGLSSDVKRGENAKRVLRHTGVVRSLTSRKIESASDSKTTNADIRLRPEWKRENLKLVAFVQSTKSKRVLAVGWAAVPAS